MQPERSRGFEGEITGRRIIWGECALPCPYFVFGMQIGATAHLYLNGLALLIAQKGAGREMLTKLRVRAG